MVGGEERDDNDQFWELCSIRLKTTHSRFTFFIFGGIRPASFYENALDRRIKSPTIGGCGGI